MITIVMDFTDEEVIDAKESIAVPFDFYDKYNGVAYNMYRKCDKKGWQSFESAFNKWFPMRDDKVPAKVKLAVILGG